MTADTASIDIAMMPDLAQLADDVQRTRRPRLLARNGEAVALLVPVPSPPRGRPTGMRRRQYPDIASLAGAAGSLRQPLSWQEIQANVRAGRAEAYRATHL